jgi:2-succinyl-5-enolpyruvyl-6-hydroxy-3-cyclohexene-1-carboxylate synthase
VRRSREPSCWAPDGRVAGVDRFACRRWCLGGAAVIAPADLQAAAARALVDELARGGVCHAVVAPGSRSTPLVLALARDDRIAVHVVLDERSAAFVALGIGRATGAPAIVACTSGSATTHLHPAVVEAAHGRVPLIALTADRPPELQATGAPQTIDQHGLFGGAVRWAVSLPPPGADDPAAVGAHWRSVAARAASAATGPPAGPVHVNVQLREPLLAAGIVPELASAPDGQSWTSTAQAVPALGTAELDALAREIAASPRGLVVAGWGAGASAATVAAFAAATGWPVLADPLSGLRTGTAVSTYEALLRMPGFGERFRPDVVLRLGAPPTSKTLGAWLGRDVRQIVVDPDAAWLDPGRAAARRLVADPEALLLALTARAAGPPADEGAWAAAWAAAETGARRALDALLDGWAAPTEPRVARDLVAGLPNDATLVVASSMPVRDVEWFAAPRSGVRVVANRGTNGIDGFTSTVVGVALGSGGPTVGLCGDLAFLHDAGGLLGAARRHVDATIVVVDNDGGGIFSFLPQAESGAVDDFEALFGTPHGLDLAAVAQGYGIPVEVVDAAAGLVPAVRRGGGGLRVVLVRTDRADNVARHRAAWAAVAAAIGPPSTAS